MNKKDIDKLFQEKLKDLHQRPDDKVWRSIEHSLDQRKKSRRVVPIWWKLGGAAAILAIALMVFGPFGTGDSPESSVTGVENPDTPAQKQDEIKTEEDLFKDDRIEEGVVSSPENEMPESGLTKKDVQDPASVETGIADKSDDAQKPRTIDEAVISIPDSEVATVNEDKDQVADDEIAFEKPFAEETAIAQTENEARKEELIEDASGKDPDKEILQPQENETYEEAVTEVAQEESDDQTTEEVEKRSIFEEIERQEEEALLADAQESKWSVGAVVAPVYFGAIGEGSPIHSNFVSNNKSGNVNLSYGLAVGYKLSDKLSVRSGLNKVDYGYDTNDISFSSSLVASTSTQITNINYTNTSRTLVVESNNLPETTQEFAANDIVAQSPSRNGTMIQEFGYLEVPMELNYAILDRKLNINLIGGISSLFLVDNTVVLESSGSSTEMGEANNLNDVNFSTNVGLGINYEFTDKVKVHLEPVFKYQLNTFSEVEGSFQPYTMGIYTGMSYKF